MFQRIVNNEPDFVAAVASLIDEFVEQVGADPEDGASLATANRFGLLYATGCLAREMGVLPSEIDTNGAVLACYRLYQAHSGKASFASRLRALIGDSRVIDLGGAREVAEVTDKQRATAIAYIRHKSGTVLLYIRKDEITRVFEDWNEIERSKAVKRAFLPRRRKAKEWQGDQAPNETSSSREWPRKGERLLLQGCCPEIIDVKGSIEAGFACHPCNRVFPVSSDGRCTSRVPTAGRQGRSKDRPLLSHGRVPEYAHEALNAACLRCPLVRITMPE